MAYPPALQETIAEHDACIWALGVSTAGMSEDKYTEITVGYLSAFLDALKEKGVGTAASPFRVVFVSGLGADSTETSTTLFKRVKVRSYAHRRPAFRDSCLCSRVARRTT
jgi:hypothetical protein